MSNFELRNTNMLKQFFHNNFKYLKYFYRHLSYRIGLALVLSSLVGLLDGLGLAMFLPLLQLTEGNSTVDSEGMGNLNFLTNGLASMGIELTVFSVLIVILGFFVLKGLVKFVSDFYKVRVKYFFVTKLRYNCIELLSNYQYKAFVTSDSGVIQNTLSGEVGRVVTAFMAYFGAIQNLMLVLVYVGLAFLANPQFAILVALGGALTNMVFKRVYSRTKQYSRKITNQNHYYQGLLIQQVAFFKYLKAVGSIKSYANRLKKSVSEIEASNRAIGNLSAFLEALREPLIILVVIGVIVVQLFFFDQRIGLIILSLLFFYRSMTYLMLVQVQWNAFLAASGAIDNMEEFVSELSASREVDGTEELTGFKEAIEFTNVNFSFSDTKVLKNINLRIRKNETLAFVGESGSGKSTLINCLTGLLRPDSGIVSVDGTNLNQLKAATFQKRIGYITQEPVIFSDNVYNNVTFWAPKTPENMQRFHQALKKAAIFDFVQGLSEQEMTQLGTNGVNMSGGQKQRISIARELYKEIDILIMDEATSALDSETERVVQENIEKLKGAYTILIVAHRLSTVKNADRIVIMKNGAIEETGNFNVLIGKSPSFRRMVELQEI